MIKKYKFPILFLILGVIVVPLIAVQLVYVDSSGILREPGIKLMPIIPLSIIGSLIWVIIIKRK
ncbi:MAG: DUF3955 domain-containing protein [Vagococcus fluvialis]